MSTYNNCVMHCGSFVYKYIPRAADALLYGYTIPRLTDKLRKGIGIPDFKCEEYTYVYHIPQATNDQCGGHFVIMPYLGSRIVPNLKLEFWNYVLGMYIYDDCICVCIGMLMCV